MRNLNPGIARSVFWSARAGGVFFAVVFAMLGIRWVMRTLATNGGVITGRIWIIGIVFAMGSILVAWKALAARKA